MDCIVRLAVAMLCLLIGEGEDSHLWWQQDMDSVLLHRVVATYNEAIALPTESPSRISMLEAVVAAAPRMLPARHALSNSLAAVYPQPRLRMAVRRIWDEAVTIERERRPQSSEGLGKSLEQYCTFVGTESSGKSEQELEHTAALCREAVELLPDSAMARYRYGLMLHYMGKASLALAQFERSSQLDPELSAPVLMMANHWLRELRITRALELYNQILGNPKALAHDAAAALQNRAAVFAIAPPGQSQAFWAIDAATAALNAAPYSVARAYLLLQHTRRYGTFNATATFTRHAHATVREWQREVIARGALPRSDVTQLPTILHNPSGVSRALALHAGVHGTIIHDVMMTGVELSADQLRLIVSASIGARGNGALPAFPNARHTQPDSATCAMLMKGQACTASSLFALWIRGSASAVHGTARRRTQPLRVAYASYDLRPHPMGFMLGALFAAHSRARVISLAVFFGPPTMPEGWGLADNGTVAALAGARSTPGGGTCDSGGLFNGTAALFRSGGVLGGCAGVAQDWGIRFFERSATQLTIAAKACCSGSQQSTSVSSRTSETSVLGWMARAQDSSPAVPNSEWAARLQSSNLAQRRIWRASLAQRIRSLWRQPRSGLAALESGLSGSCWLDHSKPWVSTTLMAARCVDSMVHAPAARVEGLAEPLDAGAEVRVLAQELHTGLALRLPGGEGAATAGGAGLGEEEPGLAIAPLGTLKGEPLRSVALVAPGSMLAGASSSAVAVRGYFEGALLSWPWEVPPSCELLRPDCSAEPPRWSLDVSLVPDTHITNGLLRASPTVAPGGSNAAGAGPPAGTDVFVDAMGFTTNTRELLLLQRPSPVNVQYLGYPGTMGSARADYAITDAIITPPDRLFLHETHAMVRDALGAACAAGRFDNATLVLRPDNEPTTVLRTCAGGAALLRRAGPCRPHAAMLAEAAGLGAPAMQQASEGPTGWEQVPHPNNRMAEGLILLPRTYQVHEKPSSLSSLCLWRDSQCLRHARLQAFQPGQVHAGDILLGHIGSSARASEEGLRLWAGILRRLPATAKLVVVGSSANEAGLSRSMVQLFAACGVLSSRIVFVPRVSRASHIARLSAVDLVLDTRQYNAHSTASELLWSGVPVVTLQGDRFESRVGSSLLDAADAAPPALAGRGQLRACTRAILTQHSAAAFVAVVARMALRPGSLWRMRRLLVQASLIAPLHDSSSTAYAIETGYRAALTVRYAQVSGIMGHEALAGSAKLLSGQAGACLRAATPSSVRHTVAPAASAQVGGWLPFHIVVAPASMSRSTTPESLSPQRASRIASAALSQAVGWNMECDALDMADRSLKEHSFGPVSAALAGRMPSSQPHDAVQTILDMHAAHWQPRTAGGSVYATDTDTKPGVAAPDASSAVACGEVPVLSGIARGSVSYNVPASFALADRFEAAMQGQEQPGLAARWSRGLAVLAAEMWYRRRAATTVRAVQHRHLGRLGPDGHAAGARPPRLAVVSPAGLLAESWGRGECGTGVQQQHCAELAAGQDPAGSLVIVSRVSNADVALLTGVEFPSLTTNADSDAMETIRTGVVCFAAIVNATHGGVALRDLGVGLWPVQTDYGPLQTAPAIAQGALDPLGAGPMIPGLLSVMGSSRGTTAAGTTLWHHCSPSRGCSPQMPGKSTLLNSTGWLSAARRMLLRLQLGHVATRLQWCHRAARDLADVAQRVQAAYNPWVQRLSVSSHVLVTVSPVTREAAALMISDPRRFVATALRVAAAALAGSEQLPEALRKQHATVTSALQAIEPGGSSGRWSAACVKLGQLPGPGRLDEWLACAAELGVAMAANPLDTPVLPDGKQFTAETARALEPTALAAEEAAQALQLLASAALPPGDAPVLVPSLQTAAQALAASGSVAASLWPAVVARVSTLDRAAAAAGASTMAKLAEDEGTLRRVCAGLALCHIRTSQSLASAAAPPTSAAAAASVAVAAKLGLQSALQSPAALGMLPNWLVHAGQSFRTPGTALAGGDEATRHSTSAASSVGRHLFSLALGSAYFRHAAVFVPVRHAVRRPRDRPTLVIIAEEFRGGWYPHWGPWTSEEAGSLGGSEEAALSVVASMERLCRGDPALCLHVEVYKEVVPEQHRGVMQGGAVWYPTSWYAWQPPTESLQECQRRASGRTSCSTPMPRVIVMSWRYASSLGAAVAVEEVADAARRVAATSTPGGIVHSGRDAAAMLQAVTGGRVSALYLWLQDDVGPIDAGLSAPLRAVTSGVFFLSHFHAKSTLRHLPGRMAGLVAIARNGIDRSLVDQGGGTNHDPLSLLYASAPNRGLETVLRSWPVIRRAVPEATLHVYYGFTSGFQKYIRRVLGELAGSWLQAMQELLGQPGVHYHGMVAAPELAAAYSTAGFLLYPTSFPETGCIAVAKAMAQGVIPITSRYPESVLPELLPGDLDWGPPLPGAVAALLDGRGRLMQSPGETARWEELRHFPEQGAFRSAYASAVIDALRTANDPRRTDHVQQSRAALAASAAERLTWDETALRMLHRFHNDSIRTR